MALCFDLRSSRDASCNPPRLGAILLERLARVWGKGWRKPRSPARATYILLEVRDDHFLETFAALLLRGIVQIHTFDLEL